MHGACKADAVQNSRFRDYGVDRVYRVYILLGFIGFKISVV